MDMKRQVVDCAVRSVGDRTLTFVASTEKVARDGDIIRAKGWQTKEYEKNPIVLFNHNPDNPVGRAKEVRKIKGDDPHLEIDVEFAGLEQMSELAESVHLLARDGFLNAGSVGYIPLELEEITEKKKEELGLGRWGRVIKRADLLEFSIVSVPADPGALKLNADPDEYRHALACVRSVMPADQEGFDELERALPDPPEEPTEPDGSRGTDSVDVISLTTRFDALDARLETLGTRLSHIERVFGDIRTQLRIANNQPVPSDRAADPSRQLTDPPLDEDERDLYGVVTALQKRIEKSGESS